MRPLLHLDVFFQKERQQQLSSESAFWPYRMTIEC